MQLGLDFSASDCSSWVARLVFTWVVVVSIKLTLSSCKRANEMQGRRTPQASERKYVTVIYPSQLESGWRLIVYSRQPTHRPINRRVKERLDSSRCAREGRGNSVVIHASPQNEQEQGAGGPKKENNIRRTKQERRVRAREIRITPSRDTVTVVYTYTPRSWFLHRKHGTTPAAVSVADVTGKLTHRE